MRFQIAACLIAVLLAGCATAPPPMLWIRADGQRGAGNPVLEQEFDMAKTVCLGERQKAALSGVTVSSSTLGGVIAAQQRGAAADQVGQGCMAEKGYVQVPADQAEERLDQYARVATLKKQQEAAAAAALQPSPKRR